MTGWPRSGRWPAPAVRDPGVAATVWWSRTTGDPRPRARALLRRAAASVLDCPQETVEVAYEAGGRPYVAGTGGNLHVGVGHCRAGVVAVVVSTRAPVGVDIEVVRPLPAVELARRFMLAPEAEWVAGEPEELRVLAFLWLWTHKEAIGKAYGTGLRQGGLRRPVPPPRGWPSPVPSRRLRAIPGDPGMCTAAPYPRGPLVLAVACGGQASDGASVAVHEVARDG